MLGNNTKFSINRNKKKVIKRKINNSHIHKLHLNNLSKVNILKEGIILEKGLNPKIVHRTWKTKPEGQMLIESKKFSNFLGNEWEVKWYDDKECRDMIKENFKDYVLKAYDCLIPPAYKSDLWRYCCVYLYGGFYLDASLKHGDMHYDIIRNICDIFLIRGRNKNNIYQANFMCKSGEILLKECILKICEYHKTKNITKSALGVTGPGLVGFIIRKLYGLNFISSSNFIINNTKIKLGDHVKAGKYIYKNYNISFGKYNGYITYQKKINKNHYTNDWKNKRIWLN